MENRNYSRWVLLLLTVGILLRQSWPFLQEQLEQNTKYTIQISGNQEITEEMVRELAKLSGMEGFYPILGCTVTLQMKSYTMSAQLRGVDLSMYPLALRQVASRQLTLDHKPQLLIQENLWKELRDTYDHGPLESQVKSWKENYSGLELTLNWEGGSEAGDDLQGAEKRAKRQASIAGILEGNGEADIIYMDRQQLLDWAAENGTPLRIKAGCLRIRGLANTKKAREILEEAGFEVTKAVNE